MGKVISIDRSWGRSTTLPGVRKLIERGVLLQRKDMRRVTSHFAEDERDAIIEQFADTFCKHISSRAMAERTVESLLVWLTWTDSNRAVRVFIDKLRAQENFYRACWVLTEVALADDVTQIEEGERVFATSIFLVCELGRVLHAHVEDDAAKFSEYSSLCNHLATWLLSLSSINSSSIRLSLLNYFGSMSYTATGKKFFNRIMRRFGYTVLDQLFFQLFNRRSEAMALEYMLHNLPCVLGGDYFTQNILRSIFQHYMYRNPERSLLFLRTFADELLATPPAADAVQLEWQNKIKHSFIKHLAALYLVVAEINGRALIPEFLEILNRFQHEDDFHLTMRALQDSSALKPYFRSWLSLTERDNVKLCVPRVSRKRGRRPSFARTKTNVSTLEMVSFLVNNEVSRERKAS